MAAPGGVAELSASVLERVEFPDGPLVVALSGGADSAVLAWAARTRHRDARAVFVDHRQAAAAGLRAAAEAIADRLGITLDTVAAPIDGDANFEERARTARYDALVAAAKPDEWIVTGHTADDQAETVLGNVLRGAGAAGLAGIPGRRPPLARPLLAITRAETRALAGGLGLPYFDDPANEEPGFRRNRLRHRLIPHLEAEFNPNLRSALLRTAEVVKADDDALEEAAAAVPVDTDGEVVRVAAVVLSVVSPAVASRVVRRALRTARGPHAGSMEEVSAVLAVAGGKRRGAELAGGWRAVREGPMVVLARGAVDPAAPVAVQPPASLRFDRWALDLAITDRAPPVVGGRTQIADAGAWDNELVVRPADLHARIDIGTGSKAVGDALAEAGIPARLRPRRPILTSGERLVMIPGVRTAAWAWRRKGSTRYLVARISVIGPEGT